MGLLALPVRILHAWISGSRLWTLSGLRHAMLIEAPTPVARPLAGFVAGSPTGTGRG